jgi:hypothetical protein
MDEIILIGIVIVFGLWLGVKTRKDREKGKIDTLKNVPFVGKLSLFELWQPKNNRDKNIILGKLLVVYYCIILFILDGINQMIFAVMVLIPVLFHLEFLNEDGLT